MAKEEQIIATPMLIKKLPLPLRKLIGGMSDTEKFLVGINLKTKNSSTGNNEENTTSRQKYPLRNLRVSTRYH